MFQSTHSLRSATLPDGCKSHLLAVSIHALLAECDARWPGPPIRTAGFNPRTPCGVRQETTRPEVVKLGFQSTHSLRSATCHERKFFPRYAVSIHALLAECDGYIPSIFLCTKRFQSTHSLRSATTWPACRRTAGRFQSTHSLRSATAPDLIHCYSTEQIILCANLPKKTVIARLLFLSIYLSIFYSQCITPIADLPGNSCELEVGAQAMFNSL